ncbi:MAG: DUF881 domain-containing protein [Hamadaea sp.]|uniref:DUF881 domain-containing protein n=1 Tax=Hamadaea sp. TaxID=2024425 RepID=UPI00180F9797|nr:DUF881 domain-containing protein [Hamadaea sp.]NUR70172.1 DUF881 domain-containing protein [Hamadaea sp.]NUT21177.1 DUF881 domain-containing protein [Hamadaea sp.]
MTNPQDNQPGPEQPDEADSARTDADAPASSGDVRGGFRGDFDAEQTIRLDRPTDDDDDEDIDADSADATASSTGVAAEDDAPEDQAEAEPTVGPAPAAESGAKKPAVKVSAATIVIAVLVGLLGFALIVQVRGTSEDSTLASARTDDLVRILSDLDSNENRVRQEIADLEQLKRELTAGSESADAARTAAEQRADELGILAGTLPAEGTGLTVRFSGQIRASRILDAVEELRNAGAEAMQISSGGGQAVRIIVSTYFQDADGGLNVGGTKLTGPYTITVIGDPATMKTALNIPGGVVATVSSDGGNVIVEDPGKVTVSALAAEPDLQYAQPAS